jgi:CsoR family transcriptional regulator, copper-sensing transcriptional repressor
MEEAHIEEATVQDLLARLARIEGQVRGVSKMVQEQRSCDQVLMQVMAIRAALEKVAATVVTHGIDECLLLPPEQARQRIGSTIKLLTKV